ncbi:MULTISPECIES: RluA family pseudouridine synthase [Tessaracoccus]|uniref:RluA family pseudouridine synthase n=1 Tax=Tessaracoccus TaxID=72763 RepID=UPI00099E17B4|nr:MULTISPECIES: RluA family pseudouridine synthase [Tessaracoccus]AQX16725.1 RNA pseudouridine synthase [Tessaracoccus sp. T2.5-30]VEP41475.1 putative RNA pseudouridine synthase [Tessaracoccus lapidicaptus]
MSVFLVPDGLAGDRVDATAARVSGYSRSRIESLIEAGGLLLGGVVVAKGSQRVAGGELLEIVDEAAPAGVRVSPRLADGLRIVHEDAHLVVVDKPVGVAAHPSLGWEGPSVVEHLAAAGVAVSTSGAAERQGVVQRLDVGTSGLMVVAKSEVAYSVLKQAFRDRTVEKVYHALVQGHPDPFAGTIEAPIARHPGSDWKMAIVEGGRHSVTHYETLEAHRAATLLQVHLETGRTHQIRVHMAAIGHPCVGDPLYGADPVLAQRLGLVRQWLHAVRLGFTHPTTGEYVTFDSPYPEDLAHALELVRAG